MRRGSVFPIRRRARSLSPKSAPSGDNFLEEQSAHFLQGLHSWREQQVSDGPGEEPEEPEARAADDLGEKSTKRGVRFASLRNSGTKAKKAAGEAASAPPPKAMSRRRHTTSLAAMATQRFAAEALLQFYHTETMLGDMRRLLYASTRRHATATADTNSARATRVMSNENESIGDVLQRLIEDIDRVRSALTRLEERLQHTILFAPRRGVRRTTVVGVAPAGHRSARCGSLSGRRSAGASRTGPTKTTRAERRVRRGRVRGVRVVKIVRFAPPPHHSCAILYAIDRTQLLELLLHEARLGEQRPEPFLSGCRRRSG